MEENVYELPGARTLHIVPDSDPQNPRLDSEPVGLMICAHRRYALGDVQLTEDPVGGLLAAVHERVKQDVSKLANTSKAYKQALPELRILDRAMSTYDARGGNLTDVIATISRVGIIAPLYLFDHSGITMRTTPFGDHWDSGLVGHIFISFARIRHVWGGGKYVGDSWVEGSGILTKKRLAQAESCLNAEVETYDQFLTGDVWGYQIEDAAGNEEDSCWGYFGHEWATNGILGAMSTEDEKALIRKYPETFKRRRRT